MISNGEESSAIERADRADNALSDPLYQAVVERVNAIVNRAPDDSGLGAADIAAISQVMQQLGHDDDIAQFASCLIRLLILTANATRGCILWVRQGQWQIAVEETIQSGAWVHQRRRFPRASRLPLTLVGRAARNHERVLVYAGDNNAEYEGDRYLLARQPQVAFCSPALFRNALMAVIYLENEANPAAFTPRRLAMVDLIVAQAAAGMRQIILSDELSQEIDRRQQAQARIAATASVFRELFQSTPLCIFVIDVGQQPAMIREANRRAEKVYGYTAEAFRQMPAVQLAPPEAEPAFRSLFERIVPGEPISLEIVNQRADSTRFPVRILVMPRSGENSHQLLVTVEDISSEARRRSEAEAIDAERRRIAHEIHDGVAQDLAGLRFDSALWHALIDQDPSQVHARVDQMQEVLTKCIFDLRRAILAIRPVDLEGLGFLEALRRFMREFAEQRKIAVRTDIVGDPAILPVAYELPLYRIVQEAFHNVAQHAEATEVRLFFDLSSQEPRIQLQISDNGRGFDPGRIDLHANDDHYGLYQMRERVEELDGHFAIHSQPGAGTTLKIELPTGNPGPRHSSV